LRRNRGECRKEGDNIEITTLNVRSQIGPEKPEEFELSFNKEKLDILGLAEARKMGYSIIQTNQRRKLFCFIGSTPGQTKLGRNGERL